MIVRSGYKLSKMLTKVKLMQCAVNMKVHVPPCIVSILSTPATKDTGDLFCLNLSTLSKLKKEAYCNVCSSSFEDTFFLSRKRQVQGKTN